MEYIALLPNVHQYDRTSAGGKGINLGELISAGLPVPPGFLVLTPGYKDFVTANHLQTEIERLAQTVSSAGPDSTEQAVRAISELFEQGVVPDEIQEAVLTAYQDLGMPAVAVRSSATAEDLPAASFAGLQDTFLQVNGEVEILSAIKRCWASLWSARALAYRKQQRIAPHTVHMAVIVQQMVEATAAGILFTCNPMTGVQNEIVINASWGLGEAIVSGHVNPDTLILDKANGEVRRMEIAEKQLMTVAANNGVTEEEVPSELRQQAVLSTRQIHQLYQFGIAVEAHFRTPQDIEWAIAGEQIFLLQARPVTTLSATQRVTVRQEELPMPGDDAWERRDRSEIHSYDLWTRTNVGENFLDPITPLTATLWPAFFVLGRLPTKAERAPGEPPLPTLGERFYGRMYVNEGAVIHGAVEWGIPTSFIDSTWGSSGRGTRSSDNRIHFLRFLSRIPPAIGSILKERRQQSKQRLKAPKQPKERTRRLSPEQLFAQVDQWVEAFQEQDLSQLDDHALWSYVPLWIERGKTFRSILLTAGLAGITFYFLERRVSKWTGKRGQASILVQALTGVCTAEVGSALWQMAQILRTLHLDQIVQNYPVNEALTLLRERPEAETFLSAFQTFLLRHGYRCSNDAELHNPRWAEQPEQLLEMLKSYLRLDEKANPAIIEQRRLQEREETTASITTRLNPLRKRFFGWLLKQAQDKTRLRDNNRSYVAKFLYPMRLLLAELGRRWAARGWLADCDDIFFLTLYEINDIVGAEGEGVPHKDLVTITAARRTAFDYWHTIIPSGALGPDGVPLPDPEPDGTSLQGLPASVGRVRGTARLVRSIKEATRLVPGDILVTQGTDPGWTPVFPLVSGLVLEVGGLLSHGAIIAREYGIPAVINVPSALNQIKDGQIIEVDGTSGRVYLDMADVSLS
jgi:rifampicin phosphotransferase